MRERLPQSCTDCVQAVCSPPGFLFSLPSTPQLLIAGKSHPNPCFNPRRPPFIHLKTPLDAPFPPLIPPSFCPFPPSFSLPLFNSTNKDSKEKRRENAGALWSWRVNCFLIVVLFQDEKRRVSAGLVAGLLGTVF